MLLCGPLIMGLVACTAIFKLRGLPPTLECRVRLFRRPFTCAHDVIVCSASRLQTASTALHLAASKGHAAVVQVLLDSGADTSVKDGVS